jgi:hypothetical protein
VRRNVHLVRPRLSEDVVDESVEVGVDLLADGRVALARVVLEREQQVLG